MRKPLERLEQLQTLRRQRSRIASARHAEARGRERQARDHTREMRDELDRLESDNNRFVSTVLDRSRRIVDPGARIAAISWKIKTQNQLIRATDKVWQRAERDHGLSIDAMERADLHERRTKASKDAFDEIVTKAVHAEQVRQELRQEDLATEISGRSIWIRNEEATDE